VRVQAFRVIISSFWSHASQQVESLNQQYFDAGSRILLPSQFSQRPVSAAETPWQRRTTRRYRGRRPIADSSVVLAETVAEKVETESGCDQAGDLSNSKAVNYPWDVN
jgi:hypothetical protein